MNAYPTADFPMLRASLSPQYATVDPAQLRALVQQVYGPGATPEDVEGFFGSIGRGFQQAAGAVGRFAQRAAPVLQNALPGIASGALAGSALGPWGALAGAVAGGAGGILSQSRNPTARAVGLRDCDRMPPAPPATAPASAPQGPSADPASAPDAMPGKAF
ncbi:hypothetical protein [Sphingomonas sp.]